MFVAVYIDRSTTTDYNGVLKSFSIYHCRIRSTTFLRLHLSFKQNVLRQVPEDLVISNEAVRLDLVGPISQAAFTGDVERLKELLQNGADVAFSFCRHVLLVNI